MNQRHGNKSHVKRIELALKCTTIMKWKSICMRLCLCLGLFICICLYRMYKRMGTIGSGVIKVSVKLYLLTEEQE